MWGGQAVGQQGGGSVGDSYNKWKASGAKEFVPGGPLGAGPGLPAPPPAGPNGIPMGPVFGPRGPMGPMGWQGGAMNWQGGPMGPGGMIRGPYPVGAPGQQVRHLAGHAQIPVPAPQQPAIPVVIWNLNPDYSEAELKKDLEYFDFEPQRMERLKEPAGAFKLEYSDKCLVNSLVVSLDDTTKYLKGIQEPLRVAKFDAAETNEPWSSDDVPDEIQSLPTFQVTKKPSGPHGSTAGLSPSSADNQ